MSIMSQLFTRFLSLVICQDSLLQLLNGVFSSFLHSFIPSFLYSYIQLPQNLHWSDLIVSSDKQDKIAISETERKRRETVWELFKCECVFLIDHLMVIKHVSARRHVLSNPYPTNLYCWVTILQPNFRAKPNFNMWRIALYKAPPGVYVVHEYCVVVLFTDINDFVCKNRSRYFRC